MLQAQTLYQSISESLLPWSPTPSVTALMSRCLLQCMNSRLVVIGFPTTRRSGRESGHRARRGGLNPELLDSSSFQTVPVGPLKGFWSVWGYAP